MKEKNNTENIVETDVENIPITAEEIEKPQRNIRLFRRNKDENGQVEHHKIQANELSGSAKKSMVTRIISAIVGLVREKRAITIPLSLHFKLSVKF